MAANKWEEVVDAHHGEEFFGGNHVTSDEVLI